MAANPLRCPQYGGQGPSSDRSSTISLQWRAAAAGYEQGAAWANWCCLVGVDDVDLVLGVRYLVAGSKQGRSRHAGL